MPPSPAALEQPGEPPPKSNEQGARMESSSEKGRTDTSSSMLAGSLKSAVDESPMISLDYSKRFAPSRRANYIGLETLTTSTASVVDSAHSV